MWGIFKKQTKSKEFLPLVEDLTSLKNKSENKAVQEVDLKDKSVKEIIEEIHESFYTEVDKLLESAKISKSIESQKESLIDKRNKLVALGFTNTKEVQEANIAIDNLKKSESIISAINYFSQKYPLYKFITEDSVIKICEKYNLVYGDSSKYIGKVPDKNLKEMQNFKIENKDYCFIKTHVSFNYSSNDYISFTEFEHAVAYEAKGRKYIKGHTIRDKEYLELLKKEIENNVKKSLLYYDGFLYSKCNLEIAAPLKDFNMDGQEVKNFKISKIEIPDPIVLQPVYFDGQKHYLIVTAWGLEAGDELVINANHN